MDSNQKNPGTTQNPEKPYPQTERESDNRGKEENQMNKGKGSKESGNEDTKKGEKYQK